MKKVFQLLGIALVILSLYLAFNYQFKHFYEFLLIGQFLVLHSLISSQHLSTKIYLALYFPFVFFGFIIDWFVGLTIAELWHYSYQYAIEYVVLYLFIYPVGGYVLLQSYLLGKTYVRREDHAPASARLALILLITSVILLVIIVFLKDSMQSSLWGVLFGISFAFLMGMVVTFFSEKLHHTSYFRDLITTPVKTLTLTVVATYFNLILHEYPNTFSQHWIYTINTNTLLDYLILGLPLIVWIVWPTLLIGSVSLYYLFRK